MTLPRPVINDIRGPSGQDVAAQFGDFLALTYWDLWCLLAAKQSFAGELPSLREALIARLKSKTFWSQFTKELVEDLIALSIDLEDRIRPHGSVSEFILSMPERIVKKEAQKAMRNILEQGCHYPPSEPMLRSPRRLLEREAYRGTWDGLPINPAPFAEKFRPLLIPQGKTGFLHKGMTFSLSKKLQKQVERELAMNHLFPNPAAHRYAIYRALITLFHEEHHWDDSYGTMGELGIAWIKELLRETPTSIGLAAEILLKDLLMMLCWENYGLSDSEQIVRYVTTNLTDEERKISIRILADIQVRAYAGYQEYHAGRAERILKELMSPGTSARPSGLSNNPSHLRLVAPSS